MYMMYNYMYIYIYTQTPHKLLQNNESCQIMSNLYLRIVLHRILTGFHWFLWPLRRSVPHGQLRWGRSHCRWRCSPDRTHHDRHDRHSFGPFPSSSWMQCWMQLIMFHSNSMQFMATAGRRKFSPAPTLHSPILPMQLGPKSLLRS